ncbi:hypothetical protein C1645_826433 [Glomus cerebriforme]|uniref:Uncharacterized protein n=1 Tax=Glomus cerebriforme TaxID=658196 RepID=A0A397SQU1_9GLOM|nr:hypothetical protein C1645_826433 [Glomus cerebriforme]
MNSELLREHQRILQAERNMTYKYSKCKAMMWLDERTNKSTRLLKFSICYANSKIILPPLQELPSTLNTLLTGTNPCLHHEVQNRLNIIPGLDFIILTELQQMLHNINPYVNRFRQVGNLLKHNPSLDLKLVITNNRTKDS